MEASVETRRWLWRVLAGALVLRLAAAIGLQVYLDGHDPPRQYLIAGDAEGYWDLAGDIATGSEYAVYNPPRRVLRMPGFPFALAVPRLICGDRLFPARLWLACVGTFACWGVYRLGADITDPRTGVFAAGLAALSPVLVMFTPLILSETTFSAAMLISLIPAARLWRTHVNTDPAPCQTGRLALLAGLAMALATYVHPSWLLIGPTFGLLLTTFGRKRRRAMRDALVLCAGLFAALLPWGLRNQRVTGHFVLTSLWMGPSLYDGLNPAATGDSNMTFFDRDNLQARGLSEYEINAYYRGAAWRFARENPGRTLVLAASKLWRYWKPWPNAEQFRLPVVMFVVGGAFVAILALAVVGAVRSQGDLGLLVLTLGPIVYFSAVHLFFVSSLRYRLPAEYPLLVLSAVGLRSMYSRWSAGSTDAARSLPHSTGGT
jgi:hypothetical protein